MTKRRYHLPILAAVIGLVTSGCGGGGGDPTITVTVSGPSANERALGIATAIAPLAEGETAPALRQITPVVERTPAGGVRVTVTGPPPVPFLNSWTARLSTMCGAVRDCGAARRDRGST